MRIALFHPSLIHAGIPRVFVNLARGFLERGHVVDLVQASPEGDFRSQVPDGVRLIDLNAKRAATSVLPLAKYLWRERPDALISGAIQTNLAAVFATRLAHPRPRLVLTEHNIVSVIATGAPMLRTRISPAFIRFFYPAADEIVAVSKGSAADLATIMRKPQDRIKVIYNPIIGEHFWIRANEPLADATFDQERRQIILAVGRLHYHKDYPTLLRAFARVLDQVDAKLVFLGSGEEMKPLKDLALELNIGPAVEFLGDVQNPLPYMRRASVLALSSVVEALPTVLIEALALNLPIIATDCPSGPREILEGATYGALVPVGDDAAMTEQLLAVLRSPEKRVAPAAALSRFQHDHVIDQYLSLLSA